MSAPTLITEETAASLGAARGRFVVKSAPPREPLFDDEIAGDLALVGPLDRPLPFDAIDLSAPSALRLRADTDSFAAQPTSRRDLPEVNAFARRLVIGIIEAVTGRRSAAQLSPFTGPRVQAGLARDAGKITRLGTARRRATLHSVHISEPADGIAEVAAIVRLGDRFMAIALRLEGLDGRWRCVRLQIG